MAATPEGRDPVGRDYSSEHLEDPTGAWLFAFRQYDR
jgi:hypothetical protein